MNGDYPPSINSGYIIKLSRFKDTNGNRIAGMSLAEQKLLLEQIKKYECYSLINTHYTNVVTNENILFSHIAFINTGFWDMYSFDFIAGRPFSESECENRKKCAVITENLSKFIFHTSNSIGKKMGLLGDEFEIVGVVDNFSILASPTGDSEIWIPFVLNPLDMYPELRILFSPRIDMFHTKEIIAELMRQFYNVKNIEADISAENLLTEKEMKHQQFMDEGGWAIGILIFIFLLVPAVNIITLNRANTHNRGEEIAIRKTFGASKLSSFVLILFENLMLALAGAIAGVLFANPVMTLLFNFMFDELQGKGGVSLMPRLNVFVILGVIVPLLLLFVLIFSGIPAWLMAKRSIVNTLKGGVK
jgi:ABC-type antimicrobial peptide transport system permease subunit